MSVAMTTTLPAQPATGTTLWEPYGGSGYIAPLGRFLFRHTLQGDAGGGNSTITIINDERYTNLYAWLHIGIAVDAAAGDFSMGISVDASTPAVHIVGTIPQVATGVGTTNSAFLWYPPPIYTPGSGRCFFICPNVGVGEQYILSGVVYCFDRDVRKITPLTVLNQVITAGNNVPAS